MDVVVSHRRIECSARTSSLSTKYHPPFAGHNAIPADADQAIGTSTTSRSNRVRALTSISCGHWPRYLHECSTFMASSWCPRNLWWCSHSSMSCSRASHHPPRLHGAQYALLLRSCGQQRDTDFVSCGKSKRWQKFHHKDCASTTER